MSFIWNQNRRRPVQAGPSEELQSWLDEKLSALNLIDQLKDYDWEKSDLSWLIANKKGKVQAWAKKELAEFDS